jgi:hypothetical protein
MEMARFGHSSAQERHAIQESAWSTITTPSSSIKTSHGHTRTHRPQEPQKARSMYGPVILSLTSRSFRPFIYVARDILSIHLLRVGSAWPRCFFAARVENAHLSLDGTDASRSPLDIGGPPLYDGAMVPLRRKCFGLSMGNWFLSPATRPAIPFAGVVKVRRNRDLLISLRFLLDKGSCNIAKL